jgi:site-specific DNA recombinase
VQGAAGLVIAIVAAYAAWASISVPPAFLPLFPQVDLIKTRAELAAATCLALTCCGADAGSGVLAKWGHSRLLAHPRYTMSKLCYPPAARQPKTGGSMDACSRTNSQTTPRGIGSMVFDETGERLTPTHAVKKGTRYRYYVSTSLITGAVKSQSNGRRIPAANLEGLVINRLRTFLGDEGAILDAIHDECHDGVSQRGLIDSGRQIAEELATQAPHKIKLMLMGLLSRVDVRSDRVEINVHRRRVVDLLAGQSIHPTMQDQTPGNESDDLLTLTVPARLKRVGREMRMLIENSGDQTAADPGLLRIIARAHDIQTRLIANTDLTVHDIAREERVSGAYIYSLLRLPSLAPDIVTAIINGRNPPLLTAKKLMRLSPRLPIDWAEQRNLLGFN